MAWCAVRGRVESYVRREGVCVYGWRAEVGGRMADHRVQAGLFPLYFLCIKYVLPLETNLSLQFFIIWGLSRDSAERTSCKNPEEL